MHEAGDLWSREGLVQLPPAGIFRGFTFYLPDQGRFSYFIQDLYIAADKVKCDVSVGQAL